MMIKIMKTLKVKYLKKYFIEYEHQEDLNRQKKSEFDFELIKHSNEQLEDRVCVHLIQLFLG